MRTALIDKQSKMVVWVVDLSSDDKVFEGLYQVESETAQVGQTWDGDVFVNPPPALPLTVRPFEVNAERDRRIASGFSFQGKIYDCRPDDQVNISGAAQMAFMAIVAGSPVGFLRWHQGATDFGWISQDNTITLMDAQTVVALGQAAAAWKQAHVFSGRAVKDMVPIPSHYQGSEWWPHV
jgi:Domain of unknown function (DUF4376)